MTDWIDELKSGEATEQLAQERYWRESFEGHGHEKDEYMNLDLDRDERLVITDQTTGRRLEDAATVSQYILSRFLNR
jgi:hypothetical protein